MVKAIYCKELSLHLCCRVVLMAQCVTCAFTPAEVATFVTAKAALWNTGKSNMPTAGSLAPPAVKVCSTQHYNRALRNYFEQHSSVLFRR